MTVVMLRVPRPPQRAVILVLLKGHLLNAALSTAQIATQSGVSRRTVQVIVHRLHGDGWLVRRLEPDGWHYQLLADSVPLARKLLTLRTPEPPKLSDPRLR